MSIQKTAPQCGAIPDERPPIDAIATMPTLAGASVADSGRTRVAAAPSARASEEQRRLAAVLKTYGPELGPGR
jgi:hypothetical protein